MFESSQGDVRCPRCRTALNEFVRALVEVHVHHDRSAGSTDLSTTFTTTADHDRWAGAANRKYGGGKRYWLSLISRQRGHCAFSGALLLFDAESGTPQKGGAGTHPLYAAVDHCDPGNDRLGHEIVCYDLNDIKGHLPADCFADLRHTPAWGRLMKQWRTQAGINPDRELLRQIRRAAG